MKIVVAEQLVNGDRYYRICIDETLPQDEQQFEEFTWGADVEVEAVQREMVLLLQDKYGEKPVTKLAVEGATIDLQTGQIVPVSES